MHVLPRGCRKHLAAADTRPPVVRRVPSRRGPVGGGPIQPTNFVVHIAYPFGGDPCGGASRRKALRRAYSWTLASTTSVRGITSRCLQWALPPWAMDVLLRNVSMTRAVQGTDLLAVGCYCITGPAQFSF